MTQTTDSIGTATEAVNAEPEIAPIRRVVVTVEFDDRGVRALQWARSFGRVLGVPLIAWVDVDNHSAERSPVDEHMFEMQTAESTRRWLDEHGGPVDGMHVAESIDADLLDSTGSGDVVVVGVDATEGFTGWALGSRSHMLAHSLRCPLVVVPPGIEVPDDAPIVVGVDGNDPADFVVEWAKQIAGGLHRPLLPVFAYNAIYDSFDNAGDYGTDEETASVEAATEGLGLRERAGRPAEVLGDVATESAAYLIIVGARREHALGGLLLGRVVDHLLHHPPSPVAIITYATPDGDPR